jgi:Spy/CpxP family protein refolding chaperone
MHVSRRMPKFELTPLLRLGSCVLLCGSLALAQQTPPPPDAGAKTMTPGAPQPPQGPPNGRMGGRDGGPDQHGPDQHAREMRGQGQEMRDHAVRAFQIEGPGGGFRGDMRIAPPGMWWKNPDLVAKLNLSADQQKKMDDIFLQFRIKLIHMKASLEEEELMLEPLINANPPDSAKALAQINRIADTRADLEKANAAMLLGVRGVLTPDQWTKLQAEEKMHHRITIGRLEMPDVSAMTLGLDGMELARLDGLSLLPGQLTLDLPSLHHLTDPDLMKGMAESLKTMKLNVPDVDLKLDELQKQLKDLQP